jgi:hypothetical protein
MGFSSEPYAETAADGTYSIDHMAPGSYRIVAVPQNEMEVRGNQVPGY